jgi:hypothetical protein
MRALLLAPTFVFGLSLQAQILFPDEGCSIRYQYDDAGNRIQRDWYCWGNEVKSSIADQDAVAEEAKARLAEVHMSAAPNPASDMVTVTFTKEVPNGMLEVLDATGRRIRNQRVAGSMVVLDISDLRQGNYWLSFRLGNERIVTAILVDGSHN